MSEIKQGETRIAGADNYYSKDFDWEEEVRKQVETDPSLQFHREPFQNPISIPNLIHDSQAWDNFHTRHSTGKFFKERRYLFKEFPELASCPDYSKILEVGCGNGSTALPILRRRENIILYACDCSNEALERTKKIISSANLFSGDNRLKIFQCDFSTTGFPSWLACKTCSGSFSNKHGLALSGTICSEVNDPNSLCLDDKNCIDGVDFVTLIFTLSAVPVERMCESIAQCFAVLKPGGLLLFRDYGLYDMTMLRFEPEQKVGYREYMRTDGTRSYFFCLDTVRNMTYAAGFTEVELEYCCVKAVNRRNGKIMRRVWVHGKFQKPVCS